MSICIIFEPHESDRDIKKNNRIRDIKYFNHSTARIMMVSEVYYDYCLRAYKENKSNIHPTNLSWEDLIRLGVGLLESDKDWVEIKL
jgi:hypothetical protein